MYFQGDTKWSSEAKKLYVLLSSVGTARVSFLARMYFESYTQ